MRILAKEDTKLLTVDILSETSCRSISAQLQGVQDQPKIDPIYGLDLLYRDTRDDRARYTATPFGLCGL